MASIAESGGFQNPAAIADHPYVLKRLQNPSDRKSSISFSKLKFSGSNCRLTLHSFRDFVHIHVKVINKCYFDMNSATILVLMEEFEEEIVQPPPEKVLRQIVRQTASNLMEMCDNQ